ncbi:hypothetical protein [Cellulomonas alba]|uniref:DUF2786 domain-containing protein n=1 Tax=Cellulomonas alba TaxID=3053467 RepID=A0ABT7SC61_9CELL|nr:hypothetical protein [Cellulomonas alba]MDM7853776.1 hypothetical protein [Cellulomonas alba]
MPKTHDETLALIRTLLAIADGGSPHEPERDLARRRAEKLMLRHSVDVAAVRMTADQARAPIRTDTPFAADMSMAAVLCDSLEPQLLTAMHRHGGLPSDKRAFAAGFTAMVTQRLRAFYAEVLTEAEAEGTSSALVLADRDHEVDAAVAVAFPRVRTTTRRLSGRGWAEGVAAGGRADIAVTGRKVTRGPGRARTT